MASIYNEYLVGEERELAIAEATVENEYAKLSTMFEMTMLNYGQMVRDAELHVFKEGGTYDDLTYLIEAADADAAEPQLNILQKLVKLIGDILSGIGNAIAGLVGKTGNPNDTIEVSSDAIEKHGKITEAVNKMSSGVSKIKSGDWSGALDILKVVAIPAAIVGAGTAAGVVLVKKKRSEVDQILSDEKSNKEKLDGMLKAIEEKISGIKDAGISGIAKSIMDKIKGAATFVKGLIGHFGSCLKGSVDKGASKVKETIDKVAKKAGETVDKVQNKVEKDAPADSDTSGVIEKQVKKTLFKINKADGKVSAFDQNGKELPVKAEFLPETIKKLAAEFTAKESMDIVDMQEMLGENYLIESSDEGYIITDVSIIEESEEISTHKSIFGVDIDTELAMESIDAADEEVADLAKELEDLGL